MMKKLLPERQQKHAPVHAGKLSGSEPVIVSNSAYRNMDFVHALISSRDAEVSVLACLISSGKRDVYLYVQMKNMPSYIKQTLPPTKRSGMSYQLIVPAIYPGRFKF